MKGSDPKTLGHNSCFFYFCEGHYGTIIMARPVSITKDRILAAALDIVRRGGSGSLTARSLSAALGCGANALFTSFGSIQGIRDAVKAEARRLYQFRSLALVPSATILPDYGCRCPGYVLRELHRRLCRLQEGVPCGHQCLLRSSGERRRNVLLPTDSGSAWARANMYPGW